MYFRLRIILIVIIFTVTTGRCSENFIVNSLGDIEPLEPLETLVFDEVNKVRGEEGVGNLIRDMQLDDAARHHSKEMAEEGYFKHDSPRAELKEHSSRIYNVGLTDYATGENLSFLWPGEVLSNEELSKIIVQGWLDSEGHRETMLTGDYDYSGIGLYVNEEGAIYSTQLFADRAIIFDEIVLSSGLEYIRRVTATIDSDQVVIYLLDGEFAGRFPSDGGTVFVDFFLKYENGPAEITLGREIEDHVIDVFYEKEVDPSAGFYLKYDIEGVNLLNEEIHIEKIGKYSLSALGKLTEPEGEMFIVDGDLYSLIEYEEDGTFSIEYPVYENTGVHSLYFATGDLSYHRIIIDSGQPVEEAFMKMQVLPR